MAPEDRILTRQPRYMHCTNVAHVQDYLRVGSSNTSEPKATSSRFWVKAHKNSLPHSDIMPSFGHRGNNPFLTLLTSPRQVPILISSVLQDA